jgi:hypothetical protein
MVAMVAMVVLVAWIAWIFELMFYLLYLLLANDAYPFARLSFHALMLHHRIEK